MDKTVVVGKIGAPYGVRGWVKVFSFTEPANNLFTYPIFIEEKSDSQRPMTVEQFKIHGEGFVAKFAGIEDRDAAALITNAQLGVNRTNLPELDEQEFYFDDLIGLTVYNQDNIKLGEVSDFFATGANDILVVKGDKTEHLIPFVPEMFVLDINLPNKQIQVRWDPEF